MVHSSNLAVRSSNLVVFSLNLVVRSSSLSSTLRRLSYPTPKHHIPHTHSHNYHDRPPLQATPIPIINPTPPPPSTHPHPRPPTYPGMPVCHLYIHSTPSEPIFSFMSLEHQLQAAQPRLLLHLLLEVVRFERRTLAEAHEACVRRASLQTKTEAVRTAMPKAGPNGRDAGRLEELVSQLERLNKVCP